MPRYALRRRGAFETEYEYYGGDERQPFGSRKEAVVFATEVEAKAVRDNRGFRGVSIIDLENEEGPNG